MSERPILKMTQRAGAPFNTIRFGEGKNPKRGVKGSFKWQTTEEHILKILKEGADVTLSVYGRKPWMSGFTA